MKTNLRISAFALALFAALALWLEVSYKYHFFFIEQNGLFLTTGRFFADALADPGGLAGWAAGFLTSLFVLPWAGAVVTAALLTGAAVLTALICLRIVPRSPEAVPATPLYFLWALPALGLLCIHFNFNYFYSGTVAYIAMLCALYLYVCLPAGRVRLVIGIVTVPLLFWWFGPVSLLYAVCAAGWEVLPGSPKDIKTAGRYSAIVLPIEAVVVALASLYFSMLGDATEAFTPLFYFADRVRAGAELWYAWIALPVAMIGSWLCRGLKTGSMKREAIVTAIQLVALLLTARAAVAAHIDRTSYHLKTVDTFARQNRWDDVVRESRGPADSYISLNYLNLALAEQGMLADELFSYDQRGPDGLLMPWNSTLQPSIVLNDIQFAIGNVAIAQEMAFEGNVMTPGYGSPRLLQRLVETNLIYGLYPVAEKYLDLLEKTLFYRDWARDRRRFLGDDAAVEADPLLGEKRRCLLERNFISNSHYQNLEAIALQNPASSTAIEYLGCYLLLAKELTAFSTLVDTHFGTPVLPTLPRSFGEAMIIIHENDPAAWERYGLSQETSDRFAGYRKAVIDGRGNSGLANVLRRSYGDTYWFYYMFAQ